MFKTEYKSSATAVKKYEEWLQTTLYPTLKIDFRYDYGQISNKEKNVRIFFKSQGFTLYWILNNDIHREDGPAVEIWCRYNNIYTFTSGHYYLNGYLYDDKLSKDQEKYNIELERINIYPVFLEIKLLNKDSVGSQIILNKEAATEIETKLRHLEF